MNIAANEAADASVDGGSRSALVERVRLLALSTRLEQIGQDAFSGRLMICVSVIMPGVIGRRWPRRHQEALLVWTMTVSCFSFLS